MMIQKTWDLINAKYFLIWNCTSLFIKTPTFVLQPGGKIMKSAQRGTADQQSERIDHNADTVYNLLAG